MNLGIEGAAAFARRYGEGGLDGYTQEQRPVGKCWIELSERLLSVAQTSAPGKAALRDLAFRTLGAMPFLQRPALERMAGLKE